LIGRYQPTDFEEPRYQQRVWSGTAVHSLYFQLLPEHGIVGFLMVAYLVWSQFSINRRLTRQIRRQGRAPPAVRGGAIVYAHALNGALIGYLAAGAFLSVAYYPFLWYFTALSATLDIAVRTEIARTGARTAGAGPG
jgi:O-antigen ligase